MSAVSMLALLSEIGASQWGLVTLRQANRYGISGQEMQRMLNKDIIRRVRRGVYALPSASASSIQELRAAWLSIAPFGTWQDHDAASPEVFVSHASAAVVYGLGDIIPSVHEFTCTQRKQTSFEDIRLHHGRLGSADITRVDGLPITSISRTVQDLAYQLGDMDYLSVIVQQSLTRDGVKAVDIETRLNRVARKYGFLTGKDLVDECVKNAGRPAVVENFTFQPSLELSESVLKKMQAYQHKMADTLVTPQIVDAVSQAATQAVTKAFMELAAKTETQK
ncbi:type IV toxin-antitoxin system AbiEi family antitoxin domain-containing protein [Bifidobacterium aquikefiricola]|uniref:AbiEi antitoxin N-terminal domain-containing protein n=1 Tax=Bifidobacterium aquikefiricola TaxID=3059038 RepID=A0AB39U6T4_9BIFI